MHLEILTDNQQELLKFISIFKRNYYLVGGTAIALHIGHRRSTDFDLFTLKTINKSFINKLIQKQKYKKQTIFIDNDQMHFLLNDIKITFFNYPYQIIHNDTLKNIILSMISVKKQIKYSANYILKNYSEGSSRFMMILIIPNLLNS